MLDLRDAEEAYCITKRDVKCFCFDALNNWESEPREEHSKHRVKEFRACAI